MRREDALREFEAKADAMLTAQEAMFWERLFGIEFKGLHSFRHTVATEAIANGVDIKTVSSILGHSQTSTTLNIYAHTVQRANTKALNLMADLLG